MKKHQYSQASVSILIVALALYPALTFARGEDSGVNIQATAGIHAGEEDSEGASLQSSTAIHAGESGKDDTSEDDTHDATTTKHHQKVDHDSSTMGRESDEGDNELEIDHESADNASNTIGTPEHVSNRGELRSFLNHILKNDAHIENVHVSSTTIETHYNMPAKFLWAIPTNISADVTVNANGSVTVTYPWYAFLFAKNGEIENTLTQTLSSSTEATASSTLSASAEAHVINLLFSILKDSQN